MMSARKCRAWTCVVLSIGFLTGCFAHVEHLPKADPHVPSFQPLPQRSPLLVGIALSGGGSRAAYFGVAGLEALAYTRQGSDWCSPSIAPFRKPTCRRPAEVRRPRSKEKKTSGSVCNVPDAL